MALFVALVFQVLFVLFSMVVNVGLLVHHKINLQNSVDLAAYYGAQKQAEMLNALAHINYQIRQSWKLLSWRLRLAASVGYYYKNSDSPPSHKEFDSWPDYYSNDDQRSYQVEVGAPPPFTCVTHHRGWNWHSSRGDWCDKLHKIIDNVSMTEITSVFGRMASSGAFDSALGAVQGGEDLIRENEFGCFRAGVTNWRITALYLAAYKLEQAMRKEALYVLAHNMSRPLQDSGGGDGFLDMKGDSVKKGMEKTLKKNLSVANRKSPGLEYTFINSLSQGDCRGVGDVRKAPGWLSEINVLPLALYADDSECVHGGTGYEAEQKRAPLDTPAYINHALNDDNKDWDQDLDLIVKHNEGLYQMSVGVEKNPWCMTYVGVYAETRPRIPFSPFGPVRLKAKAFAKPFGGRMGPWFHSEWPSGSFRSKGGPDNRTDRLLSPRLDDTGLLSLPPISDMGAFIPNYSRYVGDEVGLQSLFFLKHMVKAFSETFKFDDDTFLMEDRNSWEDWGAALKGEDFLSANDKTRALEMIAIRPDLFDTYFYSIQPDFYNTYWRDLHPDHGNLLGRLGYTGPSFLPDLGFDPENRGTPFSVENQMETPTLPDHLHLKPFIEKLFYILPQPQHLLTSWTLDNLESYELPEKDFARCRKFLSSDAGTGGGAPPSMAGDCIEGGRSGYSVKMVSRSFLESTELNLGGGSHKSSLTNPPSSYGF